MAGLRTHDRDARRRYFPVAVLLVSTYLVLVASGGMWLAGYIFDWTGGYTPAFLIGAAFNAANLVILLVVIGYSRAGVGAPMQPSPA